MKRLLILVAFLSFATSAFAQFPGTRPLKLLVPYPAGGLLDLIARRFAAESGWNVVVENKVGAIGILAADAVATAQPDGHTALFGAPTPHVIDPGWFNEPKQEHKWAIIPVARLILIPHILAVPADSPITDAREAIDAFRRGQAYATEGLGSYAHLMTEHFAPGGFPIHYRSGPDSAKAIATGEVMLGFTPAGTSIPFIRSGKTRAIAVTGPMRLGGALAGVPTMRELGYGAEHAAWIIAFLPSHTPQEIRAAWEERLLQYARHEDATFLANMGAVPAPLNAADSERLVHEERAMYRRLAGGE